VLASKIYWKSAWRPSLARQISWAGAGPHRALQVVLAVLCGCSSGTRGPQPQAAAIAAARVQNQASPYRPRLTLVARDGDPQRGVALAVHVGSSALSAAALGMLIEARMHGAGFEAAVVNPSPSGFIVYALVDAPGQVAQFIQVANASLITPVSGADAERISARWRASPPRVASSASEAALAMCSGELMLPPGAPGAPAFATELGGWLGGIGVGDVAFAVVGSPDHLNAAAAALEGLTPWAQLGASPSPALSSETTGSVPGVAGQLSLSVALWGAAPAPAIATAERLGEPDSLLGVRLAAGFPAWQVTRVVSNLNREGACLRVDLQASGAAPTVTAVARSAADALDELQHTLANVKPGPWVVAKQVLAMEGPDDAAAVAAWQALNTPYVEVAGRPPQPIVHYAGPYATPTPAGQLAQLVPAERDKLSTTPELKRSVEAGQGKFWMLLATPCGTSAEDATTAGTSALALHASALAFDAHSGVTLEPWLNVDAMGILAHAAAIAPHESPSAQAERVAEALARALLTSGPAPDVILRSRELLLGEVAKGPTPSLSLALRQTSANHPSWLDARGTWSTLTAISSRSVQLQRESFLRGKLRLASLGNHDDAQIEAGEKRLLHLLGGASAGQGECTPRRVVSAVPGKYQVEASGPVDADAIISVPLPTHPRGLSEEAIWTEWLMNRADGWLHQALLQPGLVSTARARVMGGASAAALVIEIHTIDGKREEAVAQVRGLLERLRAGAATEADARSAQDYLARREAERQRNPRGRLIDLWYGSRRAPASLESLHALHRAAFEAGREVVVLADSTE
jgi:hypothetical protein